MFSSRNGISLVVRALVEVVDADPALGKGGPGPVKVVFFRYLVQVGVPDVAVALVHDLKGQRLLARIELKLLVFTHQFIALGRDLLRDRGQRRSILRRVESAHAEQEDDEDQGNDQPRYLK